METLTLEEGQKQKVNSIIAKTPIFQALKPELIPQLLKVAEAVRYDAGNTQSSGRGPEHVNSQRCPLNAAKFD